MVAGQYDCELYSINGLILESRKRREHLSPNDLQKNKAIMESLTKGGGNSPSIDQNGEVDIKLLHILIIIFLLFSKPFSIVKLNHFLKFRLSEESH